MESNRKQDMRAERVLGEFMDTSFYSKLHDKEGNRISYKRITDAATQCQGIDVIIEVANKRILIDEKATLYYSNLMIPTFAFEVNSIQKSASEPVVGWLLNDELKTDYYMLIWPNVKCKENKLKNVWERVSLDSLKKDDFTIVEAMLIKKKSILDYLESERWRKDRIISYANQIRTRYENDSEDNRLAIHEKNNFYFYFTKKLAEKPINIVIRKDILRQLADASYFISNEQYVKIN